MSDYFYSPEICEVVELTGVEPALHGFGDRFLPLDDSHFYSWTEQKFLNHSIRHRRAARSCQHSERSNPAEI
jgi:hypothetical protein